MKLLLKIHCVVSDTLIKEGALRDIIARYGQVPPEDADVVVVWGGDGAMLQALHRFRHLGKPFYGVHCGTVGFLMNENRGSLYEKLAQAESTPVPLIAVEAWTLSGEKVVAQAINEVSVLRASRFAAKIRLSVNGLVRFSELICDGILLATSSGSTAYNLSVGGPILPLGSPLFALTPISLFRPRRWRGAILPETATVTWDVLAPESRPLHLVADDLEVNHVTRVLLKKDISQPISLLFDPDHNLEARILNEQFAI